MCLGVRNATSCACVYGSQDLCVMYRANWDLYKIRLVLRDLVIHMALMLVVCNPRIRAIDTINRLLVIRVARVAI